MRRQRSAFRSRGLGEGKEKRGVQPKNEVGNQVLSKDVRPMELEEVRLCFDERIKLICLFVNIF